MLEFHEIEELFKSEELVKSRAALKALLRNAALLRQEGLTPEQKQQAEENIKHIAATGTLPKAAAPKKEKKPKEAKPTIDKKISSAPAVAANKINPKASIDKSLNLVSTLHGKGNIEMAHKIYSAIPKDHMPDHLKNYDPSFMHYNVTPDLWKDMGQPEQKATHDFHNEILAGAHDANPELKPTVDKVKSLIKPIKS